MQIISRRTIDDNFRIVPVRGDGTCLFHAVGLLIGEDGHDLRRQVADYFTAMDQQLWEEHYRDWSLASSPQEYAWKIISGEWGGELELTSLSLMKNINIRVYDDRGNGSVRVVDYNRRSPVRVNIIRTGQNHYDALIMRSTRKARLGEKCQWASDCSGKTNVCQDGRCVTSRQYEAKAQGGRWDISRLLRAFQSVPKPRPCARASDCPFQQVCHRPTGECVSNAEYERRG